MKPILFHLLCFFALPVTATEVPQLSLEQALNQKLITFSASGNPRTENTHSGKCLVARIKNLSGKTLRVRLENGRLLIPADSQVQNMLITCHADFILSPYATVSSAIQAMCAQRNDASPSVCSVFKPGRLAGVKLRSMAKYIERYSLFNDAGQAAVWCVTDAKPVWEISMPDTQMQRQVRSFVASLTGQSMYPSGRAIHHGYSSDTHERADTTIYKSTCTFEYTLSRYLPVDIKIYNSSNVLMKTLKNSSWCDPGDQTAKVHLTTQDFPTGVYRLVLTMGHEQTITHRVMLGRMNEVSADRIK